MPRPMPEEPPLITTTRPSCWIFLRQSMALTTEASTSALSVQAVASSTMHLQCRQINAYISSWLGQTWDRHRQLL